MATQLEKATVELLAALDRMHFPAVTYSLAVRDAKQEVRRLLDKQKKRPAVRRAS